MSFYIRLSFFLSFRRCAYTSSLPVVGEAKNPRKTVPKTIRRTFWRLLIFYVGSIFAVGEFPIFPIFLP